ncbi:hypothetical protein [Geodermatophilus sp. URMC 62]|uniref:hypothetical protein n=1 Tax=Geodermatophilus sp. URMC 62 TaxID=3423414 RepID=UPI00406C09F0
MTADGPDSDPRAVLPLALREFRVRQWTDDASAREPADDADAWGPEEHAYVAAWARWARVIRRWLNAHPQVDGEAVWRALHPRPEDAGGRS